MSDAAIKALMDYIDARIAQMNGIARYKSAVPPNDFVQAFKDEFIKAVKT